MYEQAIPFVIDRFDPDARLRLTEATIQLDLSVSFDPDLTFIDGGLTVENIKDTLTWSRPSEPHAGFVVRVTAGATADPKSQPTDVGDVTSVNLRDLPLVANATGEVYSFAVAAYNQAGNEGPDGLLEGVVVDLSAPGAPTNIRLVNGRSAP